MTIASIKPDLVIWTGPVWAGNLSSVNWARDTEILTLSCKGSDGCGQLGYNLPKANKLAALLSSHGKSIDAYDKIMLGSFSAGHGLCQILLSDQPSRERIACFGSFDSYYTGVNPRIITGYLAFAKLAAQGGHLMWSSSSNFPDRTWLSCEDSIKPLLDDIDPSEASLPTDLGGKLKPPVYVVQKTGFVHANFGTAYAHDQHAKVIAPAVFESWFSPVAHGQPPESWVPKILVVGGTIAAAVGAWKLGKKLSQRR